MGIFQRCEARLLQTRRTSDNAHIESFNGSLRDECLNVNWFMSLEVAKRSSRLAARLNQYPARSELSHLTPAEYASLRADFGRIRVSTFTFRLS
jgi:putative transposase